MIVNSLMPSEQRQNSFHRLHPWRPRRAWRRDRKLRVAPGLESADQIGGAVQPHHLERRRGERRGVAFVAHDDPANVGVHGLGHPAVALGMQPPLEVVALDDNRTGNLAVSAALKLGSRVDQDGAVLDSVPRRLRIETREPRAGAGEQAIRIAKDQTARMLTRAFDHRRGTDIPPSTLMTVPVAYGRSPRASAATTRPTSPG